MSDGFTFLTLVATVVSGTALLTVPARLTEAYVNESAFVARATEARFSGSQDGIFVDARVDGKPVRFMADTGASITILSAADASALGIKSRKTRTIRGIGGEIKTHSALVDLQIAGKRIGDLDVAITENVPHSLLGLDAMQKLGRPHIVFQ